MLCTAKETINKIKTTYGMEKMFANDTTNRESISKKQKL